jgi:hypothetical protein
MKVNPYDYINNELRQRTQDMSTDDRRLTELYFHRTLARILSVKVSDDILMQTIKEAFEWID